MSAGIVTYMTTCGAPHPTIPGLTCRRDADHRDQDFIKHRRWHRGGTTDGRFYAWQPEPGWFPQQPNPMLRVVR